MLQIKSFSVNLYRMIGKVIEIGISQNFKEKTQSIVEVGAIKGQGLIGDLHFKKDNNKMNQITLIEIENINYYNKVSGTSIHPINFRRNIITKDIKLNELVGKELLIGSVKIKVHDLCRPCKYLQESLKQKNFIKELLLKGGLRCEILSSGKISVGDSITL